MKNSDKLSNETDSPKTPGGISKSLLTPIRRLGLSRKWKRSGPSPFVSPLASNTEKNVANERKEKKSRKRKLCVDDDEHLQLSPVTDTVDSVIISTPPNANANTDSTPIRRVSVTRKKSKALISSSSVTNNKENCISVEKDIDIVENQIQNDLRDRPEDELPKEMVPETEEVSINLKVKNKSPRKATLNEENDTISEDFKNNDEMDSNLRQIDNVVKLEPKIPNNLTKECIVVIQNKILKAVKKEETKTNDICNNNDKLMSQVLFDSDTDDVPLSHINKKENLPKNERLNLDDDFVDSTNNIIPKVQQSKNKTSTSSKKNLNKSNKIKKHTEENLKEKVEKSETLKPLSQSSNSFDDDDDDFEPNKRTILVRKSYDKVIKPLKAKSTGSITQKDIDELKARIEMKKKILIAKSMTEDTEELRGLIKKWQKGCQDALMELLELMKKKLPDQTNMDHSYILQMLKIPPALVGYDPENDCFHSPDDNSILASTINDL